MIAQNCVYLMLIYIYIIFGYQKRFSNRILLIIVTKNIEIKYIYMKFIIFNCRYSINREYV